MIVGTGVDLVEVARIEGVCQRYGALFAARILHAKELASLPEDGRLQARWLAKRWAVKEAAAKALGTGFRQGIKLSQFCYDHDVLGKPLLSLFDEAKAKSDQLGICSWHVSVSDEKQIVIAMVIAES